MRKAIATVGLVLLFGGVLMTFGGFARYGIGQALEGDQRAAEEPSAPEPLSQFKFKNGDSTLVVAIYAPGNFVFEGNSLVVESHSGETVAQIGVTSDNYLLVRRGTMIVECKEAARIRSLDGDPLLTVTSTGELVPLAARGGAFTPSIPASPSTTPSSPTTRPTTDPPAASKTTIPPKVKIVD